MNVAFLSSKFKWNCLLEQMDCSCHIVTRSETELRLGIRLRLSFQMKIARKKYNLSDGSLQNRFFQHFVKGWGTGIQQLILMDTNWTYSPENQKLSLCRTTLFVSAPWEAILAVTSAMQSHWLWLGLGSYPWQSLQRFFRRHHQCGLALAQQYIHLTGIQTV